MKDEKHRETRVLKRSKKKSDEVTESELFRVIRLTDDVIEDTETHSSKVFENYCFLCDD